ncbi:MAG: pirin family protein [Gammaproteobacteria bacterium]|nr:pirin family protein [Pseudomonadales bacterium]MCP5346536.1 pirin family protein [Pseudomonadales bacterium]
MTRYAEEHDSSKLLEQPCTGVALVIKPREKDLGGFTVRRVLPVAGQRMVGPWIFFDHMGPATFPAGQGIDVRPHPHINLATVTYLFEGEILHRDSLGSVQAIQPGDINLMVAGSGIVHSERERPEVRSVEHVLHGLQLWLALPEADEEIAPAFHHYSGRDIPRVEVNAVPVRVMMGAAFGVTSPVITFARTLYAEASLQAGQALDIPDEEERALYVASGRLRIRDTDIEAREMAVLQASSRVTIEALEDTRVAVIGGERLGQRFIDWNFVSSRRERIEQAKALWRAGGYPKVPGDEKEFIPLPQ